MDKFNMNAQPNDNKMAKGNILIVDDHAENLRLLSGILTKNGYSVRPAINGALALESIQTSVPDLILLDIRMPGIDGYEVCRKLKESELTHETPVIFVSAMDEIVDKVKAFESGGVDFITKPFHVEEVLSRIKTHLSLREMRKQLQKANDELERRVEERTSELASANKALAKAKDAAEAASRAKSEFIANISHELKTPLNPIIGLSDLLQSMVTNEKHVEYLTIIKNAATGLLGIVNDLIELSAMETQEIESEKKRFNPGAVLGSVVHILTTKAKSKGLTVISEFPSDMLETVVGNANILEKILLRIGENAIKFTEKGEIRLSVSQEIRDSVVWLHVKIADTGIGIPEDKMEKIFQDFSQADGSLTRKYGGLGLGLTIVRRLVNYMGGTIRAESLKGKGTCFDISLPFTS